MQIKTRIQAGIILCIAATVTIGLLFFMTIKELASESRETIEAAKIVKDMAELNIIMHEYLLHPGKRSLIQWRLKYDHLEKRLLLAKNTFNYQKEKNLLKKIHLTLMRLGAVFDDLPTGLGKAYGHDIQKNKIFSKLEDRLIGELLVKSRSMIAPVFQLQQVIQTDLLNTQQKSILLIVVFLVTFTSFVTGILLWINNSVVKPVVKLKKGTQIIGSGNLNYKVGTDAKNEIGQLTKAFDKMTEDLKNTTVSKNYVDNIIHSMINSLIVVSQEGNIQSVNKATCDLLGYRSEELIEQPVEIILSKDETHAVSRGTWAAELFKKGFVKELETIYMAKDGNKIPVLFSGSVINDRSNKTTGIVFVALDITELKKSGKQRDNLLYDLNERIKELNCLYGVADIVEKHDASIDDMFQAIVDFIQLSWQYPDITCARIAVDECEYKTKYFQETAWKQSSYIWVRDRHVGAVEVYYTKQRPEMDEGPFLKEERKLIDNIADRLGKIIERKQAEKALVKSEEQFRAIFYEAPYGIALIDSLTGDIYAVNKMFAQIAGRTITEMATIDWMSITHPDDLQEDLDNMALLNAGKIPGFNIKKRYIRPDDSIAWIDMTIAPVMVEDKTKPRHLCMIQDITSNINNAEEKKRLEAEVVRASHLASIGELAAGVAHEINNPMNGIIAYSEILKDQMEEQEKSADLPDRIIKESDRVAKIVKNLLSFARDTTDEPSINHIKDILSDSLEIMGKQLSKDGIHLRNNTGKENPPVNVCNNEIRQVFMNILSNARYALNEKYPENYDNKVLEISSETVDVGGREYVRTVFHDTGTGIPKAIMKKISDPFFSTKPAGKGTGLGLSISHGIIEKHNGRILIDSAEGEFTKMTVDLPTNNEVLS